MLREYCPEGSVRRTEAGQSRNGYWYDLLVHRCLGEAAIVPSQSRRLRKFCDFAASGDPVAGDANRSMKLAPYLTS